jgi:CRISPR-associated protein Cmr2
MRYFHFTLGPVQSFVSQARRTRDFWAGSFLLSYLTAQAMAATEVHGGEIVMPFIRDDMLLKRIKNATTESPHIASLPNAFEASVPDTFDGEKIAKAVQAEWQLIADAVWNHDRLAVIEVDKKRLDKTLWDSQIKSFWEIVWVLTDANTPVLSMRKNWRSHYPPEQLGDKCTMMGEWQELSGVDRPGAPGQKDFWTDICKTIPNALDVRDGERLCAISYVKRRFVHHWDKLHPDWKLPTGVPSTSYLAAAHWIEQVLKHGDTDEIIKFQKLAKDISEYGEWRTSIRCIDDQSGAWGTGKLFASLDGPVFFRSALENPKEYKGRVEANNTLSALGALAETTLPSGRKIGHPSPFYAILLMDGDSLGETKKVLGGDATKLSLALADFTHGVPELVASHNGLLVYAGGDDVLALLPLEDALACALELRKEYMRCFAKHKIPNGYSISAAINFAHMKLPLTLVLKDVHRLLDEVAKDATGRDAIAVRVWKPGGATLTWSMKWQSGASNNVEQMNSLAAQFRGEEVDEPGHASKPLFRICKRLEMLDGGADFSAEQISKLLIAEYVTTGVLSKEELKQDIAQVRVNQLLPLCKKPKKSNGSGDAGYGPDAALLLRFLAQKGVES